MNPETRICQNCKKDFVIESEDFSFYEKIDVPAPTWCVSCRNQRRLLFRNERNFYKIKCGLCQKEVISVSVPDENNAVYCQKCWWSDKWSAEDYAKDYDFSKPFFEQWYDLFLKVPHISLLNSNSVNSEWVNQETDDKNCYLNVGGHYNEDSAYNTYEFYGKNCFDGYWTLNCDHCYENIHCERNYFCSFCEECQDCLNTHFSYDCRNCNDVIGCAGLRNKKYCIFNKQYSKEEYENFIKEHPFSSNKSISWWKNESKEVWLKHPRRQNMSFKIENSTGNDISEAKNSFNCFQGTKLENCKNMFVTGWAKDSHDCSSTGAIELCYEFSSSGGAYNSKFILMCLSSDPFKKITLNNLEYCAYSNSASNSFGCVGLYGGEYMILNKKYTKKEYKELLPKIKQHMMDMPYVDKKGRVYKYGEFFPPEFSTFSYNITSAMEEYSLTKEGAKELGFNWKEDVSDINYEFSDYVIPNNIKDVKDDILNKILKCEESGRGYKIIPMELSYYRKMGLPIPRKSPFIRHRNRISKLLPKKIFIRNCDNCNKEIKTCYSPESEEIVYCEQCYQKEVY
ncbi:MAG: hypothetical protein U9R00_01480 [Patescibacteria group bacterium]|nr:hypothetical protein [Patescibacteria group bacterium]